MDNSSISKARVGYHYNNPPTCGRPQVIEMLCMDVFQNILLFLGESSLSVMSRVCKHWNHWTVIALSRQSAKTFTVFIKSQIFEGVPGQKEKLENLAKKYSQCKNFREIILQNIEAAKEISELYKEPKFEASLKQPEQDDKVEKLFDGLLDGIRIRFAIDIAVISQNRLWDLQTTFHEKIFLRLFETDNLTKKFAAKLQFCSSAYPRLYRERWSELCKQGEGEQVIREAEQIDKIFPESIEAIIEELAEQNLIERALALAYELRAHDYHYNVALLPIIGQLIKQGDISRALLIAGSMPEIGDEQAGPRDEAFLMIYKSCVDLNNYVLADLIYAYIRNENEVRRALEYVVASWLIAGNFIEAKKCLYLISPEEKQEAVDNLVREMLEKGHYHAAEMMASHILEEDERARAFKKIEEAKKKSSLEEVHQKSQPSLQNSDEDVKEPPLKRQRTE